MVLFSLTRTSITKVAVDAIVNAANSKLLGGGGVDGAIHRAAGMDLLDECYALGGCKTGDAKITKGYLLPAKFIIHTVGPRWKDGMHGEPNLLASCYRRCIEVANASNVGSIAFPCISTGVYSYPKDLAAKTAVATIRSMLEQKTSVTQVFFCCFDDLDAKLYERELSAEPHIN